jgi:hypothetical protein
VSVDVVKLQARKYKGKGDYYLLSVPKEFVELLGWGKGEALIVRIMDLEIDGVKRKALVYYKP